MTTQEYRTRRSGSRPAQSAPRRRSGTDGARRSYDRHPQDAPPRRSASGTPRRRKKRPRRRGRLVLAVLTVLLAAGLVLFLFYRSWAKAPPLPGAEPSLDTFDGTQPYLTGDRKEGAYTFLIVGRDTAGGGNTDTLMLASYNTVSQQAALMSIPRDTMVNVSWDVKKINTVYNANRRNGDEAAAAALTDAVAGLVGFRPDFTILLEWEAVGAIVDAIGGVYFEVPFNMFYLDSYQDLYINQPAGYRLLSGSDAMQVVRWRKNNSGVSNPPGVDGSDLGRTKVQQDFIAAMLRQCLQIKNVTRINEIAQVFTEYVRTELSVGNLVWFAEQAILGGFSTENLYACTMPNTPENAYSRSYNAYLSYVVPQEAELLETVNQYFNPYKTDVTISNLDLMRVNPDGSVSSSTGALRDSAAAQVSQKQMDQPVSTQPVEEDELPPIESGEIDLPPENDTPPADMQPPDIAEPPDAAQPPAEEDEPGSAPSSPPPEDPTEPEPVQPPDQEPDTSSGSEGASAPAETETGTVPAGPEPPDTDIQ